MRRSVAAVALIRRETDGKTVYLAQWNEHWQRYSLVGGHKHDDESFRECLVREVREELGLTEGVHFLLGNEPVNRLQFDAWSERAQEQTAYTFEVFELILVAPQSAALGLIDGNPGNRWLMNKEILEGRTRDGKAISDVIAKSLKTQEYDQQFGS